MIVKTLINQVFRLWLKPLWLGVPTVDQVRSKYMFADRLAAFGRKPVSFQDEDIEGVRVEWIGGQIDPSRGIVLYLHGGGFAVRAAFADRRFCDDLSRRTGLPVALVAYSLAPENPYPAGLNDCCQVYESLLQRGIPANRIILVGHSAGANYVLVLLMRSKQRGMPQPGGAVFLSAPTDMTASSPSAMVNAKRDSMQGPNIWPWARENYIGNTPLDDPGVSPLHGDWSGLTRLQFHVSDTEIILDDTRRAVEQAQAYGVEVEMSIWHDLPHNFYFIDWLKDARKCRQQMMRFIAEVLGSTSVSDQTFIKPASKPLNTEPSRQ